MMFNRIVLLLCSLSAHCSCFPINITTQYRALEYLISGISLQLPPLRGHKTNKCSLEQTATVQTGLFSNHQVPSESCQASQKSPGRQTKADTSDLMYLALHFLMDNKGQCVLCGTGTASVPQMHYSNVN